MSARRAATSSCGRRREHRLVRRRDVFVQPFSSQRPAAFPRRAPTSFCYGSDWLQGASGQYAEPGLDSRRAALAMQRGTRSKTIPMINPFAPQPAARAALTNGSAKSRPR